MLAGVDFELGWRTIPNTRRRLQHEHFARTHRTVVLPAHLVHRSVDPLHPVASVTAGLAADTVS